METIYPMPLLLMPALVAICAPTTTHARLLLGTSTTNLVTWIGVPFVSLVADICHTGEKKGQCYMKTACDQMNKKGSCTAGTAAHGPPGPNDRPKLPITAVLRLFLAVASPPNANQFM